MFQSLDARIADVLRYALPIMIRPAVTADFGQDGCVVRLEVLRASRVVEDAERMRPADNVRIPGLALGCLYAACADRITVAGDRRERAGQFEQRHGRGAECDRGIRLEQRVDAERQPLALGVVRDVERC